MKPTDSVSTRKPHNHLAGYRAEIRNPIANSGHVVIYDAADAGIDTCDKRFAVSCETHNQVDGATSMSKAREMMKHPTIFCTDCRELAGEGDGAIKEIDMSETIEKVGHTVGPWKADGSVICKGSEPIGNTRSLYRPIEECRANGRLMAASPDLLEALRAVIEMGNRDNPDVWVLAQNAIAKATGE